MVSGWKRKTIKALLLLHCILLLGGVLMWGKGYVALAHHRHQGVLYELTEILAPHHWDHPRRWFELNMFPFRGEFLRVCVHDPVEPFFTGLLFIGQGKLEEHLRLLQPPEAVNSLVWVEGVKRSGNKEPTLIAWGTIELEGEWRRSPAEDPFRGAALWCAVRLAQAAAEDPFRGAALLSQRIYNFDRLWLIFYGFRVRDTSGERLAFAGRGRNVMYRSYPADRFVFIWCRGDGEGLPSTDILERVRAYRPGAMSIRNRLRVASLMPAEHEILWLIRNYIPLGGIWDHIALVVLLSLAIATTPYRILFYLPLMLAPRLLVWPVAILWALLLLKSLAWCVALWRRLSRPAPFS